MAGRRSFTPGEDDPLAILLLPRPLESFIMGEQAKDLLQFPGVIALEPPRLSYGKLARLPATLAAMIANKQARRVRLHGIPRAVVMFHPFQFPLAGAFLANFPECELWYGRWDRYEAAYDASPKARQLLEHFHGMAAERSSLTFAVSGALVDMEIEAGREAVLSPPTADSFPAPDPSKNVVAVSLGHLGHRVDWTLMQQVAEGMPELTLLLIGEWHDDECAGNAAYQACRKASNLVWLGRMSDEEAARIIGCADVGILPFENSDFNETGLPYRILKYARHGRRTVSPDFAGVKTWSEAMLIASSAEEWIETLRGQAGVRCSPDMELREWAFNRTVYASNQPLRQRLAELGVI